MVVCVCGVGGGSNDSSLQDTGQFVLSKKSFCGALLSLMLADFGD